MAMGVFIVSHMKYAPQERMEKCRALRIKHGCKRMNH